MISNPGHDLLFTKKHQQRWSRLMADCQETILKEAKWGVKVKVYQITQELE